MLESREANEGKEAKKTNVQGQCQRRGNIQYLLASVLKLS